MSHTCVYVFLVCVQPAVLGVGRVGKCVIQCFYRRSMAFLHHKDVNTDMFLQSTVSALVDSDSEPYWYVWTLHRPWKEFKIKKNSFTGGLLLIWPKS